MKNILIVEDDMPIALALAARLRAAGYQVKVAHDPAYAVIIAAHWIPHLIISDINLPVMRGLTFARGLQRYGLGGIPVIFMTASRQEGLWESAMGMGAAGYFEKPYDPQRLLAKVSEVIQIEAPSLPSLSGSKSNERNAHAPDPIGR